MVIFTDVSGQPIGPSSGFKITHRHNTHRLVHQKSQMVTQATKLDQLTSSGEKEGKNLQSYSVSLDGNGFSCRNNTFVESFRIPDDELFQKLNTVLC